MSLEGRDNVGVDLMPAIPMIQKRCTPSEHRSETVPEVDYEAVPVEAYGLAMFRGMGWKPGEGISHSFNQVVKPCVSSPRPKGLGLGANLTEAQALASRGCYRPVKPDGEQEKDKGDETQGVVSGSAVVVLSGPHQHLLGKVEGFDHDNGGLRKEAKTSARQDGPAAKRDEAASRSQHWLHRDLRMRFMDKQHKGGQYYNTKMTTEDVLSPDTCMCRTDEGRVLEGVTEDMLETLVPKVEGDRVMVVLGPQAGKVGRLLGRDRARGRAVVQLRRESHLVELHYNGVCQYRGPRDSDEDRLWGHSHPAGF
ncbi:G patch domain and KOW motifs-containing protein [Heterocephalus glaber]|uniref:G-patch domain and KOW motifs-containing protein n=1 Tax=Heterocephalus glaber TaxID=10181 RepID=G5C4C0_HETGA|nr:G patch domain and KOW motifs-containing protein [Heterocephalus glaber]